MHDLAAAKKALQDGGYTCVLCYKGKLTASTRRGVAPLLEWLEAGIHPGFCAADKVVGRATAYLYCLLGAKEIYGAVMSRPALQVLQEHGICAHWDALVPQIRNRQDTGPCPMEAATADCHTPEQALDAIQTTLARLKG